MPGRARSPEEIARLHEAGRAMRRGGASSLEISRALNLPISTVALYAARGGWRLCDMGDAGEAPGLPLPDAQAVREIEDFPETDPIDGARDLMRRAMGAASSGHLVEAERSLRIAERLGRLAGLMPVQSGEAEDEPTLEEMRAELHARLNRIRYSLSVETMEENAAKEGYILTDAAREHHRAMRREYGFEKE